MGEDREGISSTRKWWLLAGAIVVFLLAFDVLQGLFGGPSGEPGAASAGSAAPEATTDASAEERPSNRPTLSRQADGTIEIRQGFLHKPRIRLDTEEERTALFACLEREIDARFVAGTERWPAVRARIETDRIKDACLESIPGLPPRPGN